jgi:DNA ligase D-like protein (predicted ligase)
MTRTLPDFIPPMLAKIGKPFDSPDHLFEIKWDGIRALSLVEAGDYRMLSRRRNSLKERYPELGFLEKLPSGLALDGEIVCLRDGKPDIGAVLTREQARNPRRVQALMRQHPVTYMVFDLLYRDGESVMDQVLTERRDALSEIVQSCAENQMVFSDGIVAGGKAFFEEAARNELEGVVAKRLRSRYLPGRRTDAWVKIKKSQRMYCAILGFLAEGNEVRSLVVAVEDDGVLTYAGRVGSGLDQAMRTELYERLKNRVQEKPLIQVPAGAAGPAVWVEPGLYCTVSFLERTTHGEFRAPVFEELISE